MSGGNAEETFLVEVVRDMQGLKKGLSDREGMSEGKGMLFVLDASQEHAFWMKGMKFPLDIIFIGRDMQITEILENLQPCEECPIYFPTHQPAYVLEINAGLSRKYGLSVGDTMVFDSAKQGSDVRIGIERGLGKDKGKDIDIETEGAADRGEENRMSLPLPVVSSTLPLPAFPSCLTSVSNSTLTSLWSAARD